MNRGFVRLSGSNRPERLRELLELELLCSAQRARRRIAVTLLAVGATPLVIGSLMPLPLAPWRTPLAESWLAAAAIALGLWGMELRALRRLERATHDARRIG